MIYALVASAVGNAALALVLRAVIARQDGSVEQIVRLSILASEHTPAEKAHLLHAAAPPPAGERKSRARTSPRPIGL